MPDDDVVTWQTVRTTIPSGNAGNRQTLRAMSRLAQRGANDPVVIEAAQNAVRGTPERDDDADFVAVLREVRHRMRYTHDPLGSEVVKDPAYVIGQTNGFASYPEPMDCDDASVLTASMLGALGYQTEFVTVAADRARPDEWSHVYVRVRKNNGQWVALDPIVRGFRAGQEVPASDLTAPRAYHEGVTPMARMGCCPNNRIAMAGMGRIGADDAPPEIPSTAPWEESAKVTAGGYTNWNPSARSGATTSGFSLASLLPWNWGGDTSKTLSSAADAYAKILAAKNPTKVVIRNKTVKPGFFTNADGSTNWGKVAVVGGVAVVGAVVVAKMLKGRRR